MRHYTYPTAGIAPIKPGTRVDTEQGLGTVAYAHYQELTVDLDDGTRVWLAPDKVGTLSDELPPGWSAFRYSGCVEYIHQIHPFAIIQAAGIFRVLWCGIYLAHPVTGKSYNLASLGEALAVASRHWNEQI